MLAQSKSHLHNSQTALTRPRPNQSKVKIIFMEMWWLFLETWWLTGSAPNFWARGSGFESGISNNDPDALQDLCDNVENLKANTITVKSCRNVINQHQPVELD